MIVPCLDVDVVMDRNGDISVEQRPVDRMIREWKSSSGIDWQMIRTMRGAVQYKKLMLDVYRGRK